MNRKFFSTLVSTALMLIAVVAFTPHRAPVVTELTWTQVWGDEFNGSGGVSGDWIYDTGTGYACAGCPSNWGTGEVEAMSSSTNNVFQSNGSLNIRALHSGSNPNSGWTSGRIETLRTDFQPPAGGAMAVEARLQQPDVNTTNGLGYWPAFWMLGASFRGNYLNWPGVGEVDITEDINGRSSEFGTLHCGSISGGPCNETTGIGSGERSCAGCQTSFHIYRVEFDKSVSPEQIRWYLDGVNFFTVNSNQVDPTTWDNATNHGFFILLDLAIGGGFPAAFGGGPTSATVSGGTMLVDYVHVYYSSPGATPTPTPTQSTVQFSASSYTVNESAADAVATVTRGGDTTSAVTVDYATSDTAGTNSCNVFNGAASSRCDYLTTLGTLHFAANETSKTISIPIIDDSWSEGAESFTITLSNPTGATLGTSVNANVNISDNETINMTNPIDLASFFVRQHYIDFLNREPDQSGLNFWIGNFTPCGSDTQCIEAKRVNVSAAFYLSIEFQDTGYLVERIYKAAYGNAGGTSTLGGPHQLPVPLVRLNEFLADTQEIGFGVVVNQGNWQQQLESNKQTFAAEFVQRSRFTTAFPISMPPAQFVDTLNGNAGNPLSPLERNQLVSDLTTNAKSRAQVLRAVAEDVDLVNAEFNRAFVLMQFFGYLRRNPNDPQDTDYTGYDFWLTKLNQFNGNFQNAEMVKAFINSIEYRQRFGP